MALKRDLLTRKVRKAFNIPDKLSKIVDYTTTTQHRCIIFTNGLNRTALDMQILYGENIIADTICAECYLPINYIYNNLEYIVEWYYNPAAKILIKCTKPLSYAGL